MIKVNSAGRAVVYGLALVLAGCSSFSAQEPPSAPPVVTPPPATPAPPPATPPPPVTAPQPPARPPQPSTANAWGPLVREAQQATARGDYEQALALLERALRIDPESGEIYLQLAATHQARGDRAQARATAERGMLYCSGSAQCEALRALAR